MPRHHNMASPTSGFCVACGCGCCYIGYDFNVVIPGYYGSCDCLCLRHSCCIATNTAPRGVGYLRDEDEDSPECCKLGLYCCNCGLIRPHACCVSVCKSFCFYSTSALPYREGYQKNCVCAAFHLQCWPNCGCFEPPPLCPALQAAKLNKVPPSGVTMER